MYLIACFLFMSKLYHLSKASKKCPSYCFPLLNRNIQVNFDHTFETQLASSSYLSFSDKQVWKEDKFH